ncbi:MAG: hypothetical protein H6562_10385 [Lewinellaceae bacterium]|nr:hypothetical protein [Lewinellaceae bacterium]
MKWKLLCWLLIGGCFAANAQPTDCNCQNDFVYVKDKVEQKHPGFKVNVNNETRKDYDRKVAETAARIQNDTPDRENCASYIGDYLSFFRDKHMKVFVDNGRPDKSERNLTRDMTLESINENTWYIKLPTFYKTYWKEIDSFYDSIIPQLQTRPNLVVDLTGNTGGGPRMYLQLTKFLKKRKNAPARIALIYDRYCASACEHFVLELAGKKGVTTFGENSFGALGYGNVASLVTPNCGLKFYLPATLFRRYLKYEVDGIPPDRPLESGTDWRQQVEDFFSR